VDITSKFLQQLFPSFGSRPDSGQLQRYQLSPNWKMGRFMNLEPTRMNPEGTGFRHFALEMMRRHPGRRFTGIMPNLAISSDAFAEIESDAFIWLGHSSLMLRFGAINILVDPVFSRRASPFSFAGPRAFSYRFEYRLEDLPAPDLVIITHDHYDHLDMIQIRKLRHSGATFISPLGVAPHLLHWGVSKDKIQEFDWWEQAEHLGISIQALPTRHFAGRGLRGRNTSLWASFALRYQGKQILLGSDSGYGSHFSEIGAQLGSFDLAFLECGQYNHLWPCIHMTPEETVKAALDLRAKQLMPIHRERFALGLHPWDEPAARVRKASTEAGMPLLDPKIGELVRF
jgi:L-ascorbate metabolism protein UlaG (beta-lactamase superfamily)